MKEKEIEDQILRDLMFSSSCFVEGINQQLNEDIFDPLEEHKCKGGMTETWLVPGGKEFWLVFNTEPKRFTWIEYCPYCGYRPPNLRLDWGNPKKTMLE